MRSVQRSAPRAFGVQRARVQAEAIGTEIRLARIERGLARSTASRRAGISPDTQRRVELGDPSATIATLCVAAQAVGVDVVIRGYPGRGPSLRDTGQLAMAEILRAVSHASWSVALEVPAGERGEAIDLVLSGPREIIVIEIDRMLVDFQAQYRRNVRKRDHLAGRHQRPVRLVMAVEDTGAIAPSWRSTPACLRRSFPPTRGRCCRRSAPAGLSVEMVWPGFVAGVRPHRGRRRRSRHDRSANWRRNADLGAACTIYRLKNGQNMPQAPIVATSEPIYRRIRALAPSLARSRRSIGADPRPRAGA